MHVFKMYHLISFAYVYTTEIITTINIRTISINPSHTPLSYPQAIADLFSFPLPFLELGINATYSMYFLWYDLFHIAQLFWDLSLLYRSKAPSFLLLNYSLLYVYNLYLAYPFNCWTFGLFPVSGYYKQSHYEILRKSLYAHIFSLLYKYVEVVWLNYILRVSF